MSPKITDEDDNVSLTNRFLTLLGNNWITQAIYVAAELRLADLLKNEPKTCEDLANTTQTHAPSLKRLLRALTTIEVVKERKDGSFELTRMGTLLREDSPHSLRYWTIWWGSHLWQVWGNLLYSIKTGESARKLLTGKEGFGHLEKDPEAASIFNRALVELTRLISRRLVRTYDFSNLKQIVDVGGGYGELLMTILQEHPDVSGVVFDLEHARKGAETCFETYGLTSRCSFMSGDFFKSLPEGADLYILKSIIHDWGDEKSKIILKNCRQAMKDNGRLLLVERIMPDHPDVSIDHQSAARSDLTMLVALAAQERTEHQFRELLNSSGLTLIRILPLDMTFYLLEATQGI